MTNTRGRIRWAAGAALALGLALRLGYFYFGTALDQQLWSDMLNYVNTADAIGQNKWLHYHFFQPIGYPYVVLLLKKLTPEWWWPLKMPRLWLRQCSRYR